MRSFQVENGLWFSYEVRTWIPQRASELSTQVFVRKYNFLLTIHFNDTERFYQLANLSTPILTTPNSLTHQIVGSHINYQQLINLAISSTLPLVNCANLSTILDLIQTCWQAISNILLLNSDQPNLTSLSRAVFAMPLHLQQAVRTKKTIRSGNYN